jgi:hypothetical protein
LVSFCLSGPRPNSVFNTGARPKKSPRIGISPIALTAFPNPPPTRLSPAKLLNIEGIDI